MLGHNIYLIKIYLFIVTSWGRGAVKLHGDFICHAMLKMRFAGLDFKKEACAYQPPFRSPLLCYFIYLYAVSSFLKNRRKSHKNKYQAQKLKQTTIRLKNNNNDKRLINSNKQMLTKEIKSAMNIYSSVFIASFFFTNTDASMLRGKVDTKARGLMPLENAPTCEEINSVFPKLSCTKKCSTTYWQCVNGDVIASEMPSGSYCIDGGFAEFGQCNQSEM
jgi:hypothetical protein